MRRFDDAWVVDRTMFEYLNQGGCSCCGVTHQIMDVAMFADRCSDWESDDERKEQFSPWPSFIHEEILTERARLRVVMKEDMAKYKAFLETHAKDFAAWWHKASDSAKTRIFHVPDDEIMEFFRTHVKVKGSYEIVLCAVMEQLRNFQATRYADARTATEAAFEKVLHHEHEVFTVDATYQHTEAGTINFLEMVHALAGPKLLPIRPTQDPAETKKAEKEIAESVANVQSFRSDRRLLRIVIMRKFADVAIRKFLRDSSIATAGNNTEMDEDTEVDDDNQTSL